MQCLANQVPGQLARTPLARLAAALAAPLCCLPALADSGSAAAAGHVPAAKPPVAAASAASQAQATLPATEVRAKAQTPGATVITQQALEQEPPKNIGALFDNVVGVDFSNANAGQLGDIEIRGMGGMGSFMGVGNDRVTVELDGMEIGQSFNFGHNMSHGRQYFDAADLKGVSINKGPGAHGLAGSVRFRTKDPVDYLQPGRRWGGEVRGSYSGDSRDAGAGFSLATLIGESQSASVSYNRHYYHELNNEGGVDVTGAARTRNNPLDGHSNSLNGKWVLQPNSDHKLTVSLQHFDNDNRADELDTVGVSRSGVRTHAYHRVQKNERQALALRHDMGVVTPLFDGMTWQLSVQRTHSEGFNTIDRTSARGQRTLSVDNNHFKINSYGLRADFDKVLGQASASQIGHTLHYGLKLQHSDASQGAVRGSAGRTREISFFPRNKQWQTQLHVADRMQLYASGVSVTPSLNLTRISTTPHLPSGQNPVPGTQKFSKSAAGGGLRLEWQASDQHLLSASYQRATRMPAYGETNAQSYGHWLGRPNPNLKPETSNGLELSWASQGLLGSQKTTLFHDVYTNMVDVDCGPNFSASHCEVFNTEGKTRRYGIEFEGKLHLGQLGMPARMLLEGGAIYAKGDTRQQGSRQPSGRVNPFNGFIGLRYGQPQDRWGVSARVLFAAAKRAADLPPNVKPLPGYGAVDLTGHYRPMKNLTLSAGIYNLGDKQYARWHRARGHSSYGRYTEAGRHIRVSVRYQF